MADISAFDDIWGFDAKKAVYDAFDPAKPRDCAPCGRLFEPEPSQPISQPCLRVIR